MAKIRSYGPSFVLLSVVIGTLILGPVIVRDLTHAQAAAQIQAAGEALESSRLAELGESFRLVAQRVEPSVVHISVKKRVSAGREWRGSRRADPLTPEDLLRRFFDGDGGGSRGFEAPEPTPPRNDGEDLRRYDSPMTIGNGSGWVFDDAGHIITNNHVIDSADVIEVKFFDGSTAEAELVGADPKTDIAVLKVERKDLHPATLVDHPAEQGDIVFAFGSPFRFDFSMSQGIVSGKGRQLGILGNSGYENFIQTDAAINPGNSGGPLTNIYGQVIGMNTAIATRTGSYNGIGFAIPAEMLKTYIPQLIKKGIVRRGFLGVSITDDPRLVRSFGVEEGVVIEGVGEGMPAAKAGLQRGDVIVEIDGKPTPDATILRGLVASYPPGTEIKVKYIREGETKTVNVTLMQMPDEPTLGLAPPSGAEEGAVAPGDVDLTNLRKLGLERVRTMSRQWAEESGVPFRAGVMVVEVRPGSVADAEGLRTGAIITEVQGKAVSNVKELADEIAKRDLTRGVRMSVAVSNGDETIERFVVLALPE